MNIYEHSTAKLSPKDFQFSLARILTAITLVCVLLAIRLPQVFEQAGWILVICIVLVVLYCDLGSFQVGSAHHALRAGDFERAVVLYTRAIGARSDDAMRYHGRAVAHYYLGDFAAASSDYDKALALDAKLAAAWEGRALIHVSASEFQEAVDKATVALCLAPEESDLLLARGYIYCEAERFEDALDDLTEAIRVAPDNCQAYDIRARTLFELERYEEAVLDYSAAMDREGRQSCSQSRRCVALFRLGRYSDALADIEQYLKEVPNSIEAVCVLAQMLSTCPDQTIRDGRRALELAHKAHELRGANEWMCVLALAAAYGELGEFARAIELAEKAISSAPKRRQGRIRLQLECYQAGRPYYSEQS